jgi:hypothetical protein
MADQDPPQELPVGEEDNVPHQQGDSITLMHSNLQETNPLVLEEVLAVSAQRRPPFDPRRSFDIVTEVTESANGKKCTIRIGYQDAPDFGVEDFIESEYVKLLFPHRIHRMPLSAICNGLKDISATSQIFLAQAFILSLSQNIDTENNLRNKSIFHEHGWIEFILLKSIIKSMKEENSGFRHQFHMIEDLVRRYTKSTDVQNILAHFCNQEHEKLGFFMGSLQDPDEKAVFELRETETEPGLFEKIRKVFLQCPAIHKEPSRHFLTKVEVTELPDPNLINLLRMIGKVLYVGQHFTGSQVETPIPSEENLHNTFINLIPVKFETEPSQDPKFNMRVFCKKIVTCGLFHYESAIELMASLIFRKLKITMSEHKMIFLFIMLCHSDVTELNPGVREALLLIIQHSKYVPTIFFEKVKSVLLWKTASKMKKALGLSLDTSLGDFTAFTYFLTKWWSNSDYNGLPLESIAQRFGLKQNYIDRFLCIFWAHDYQPTHRMFRKFKSLLAKPFRNRSFNDIQQIIQISLQEQDHHDGDLNNGNFANFDLGYMVPEGHDAEFDTQFKLFTDYLEYQGFEFKPCVICDNSLLTFTNCQWKTLDCECCTPVPKICSKCFDVGYAVRPEPGHRFDLAPFICVQTNQMRHPPAHPMFPEGTTFEDLKERLREFYYCCSLGCKRIIRFQVAPEGDDDGTGYVPCAAFPDQVNGQFCEHHQFLATLISENVELKECPNCSTPIEKTGGCNHMTCTSCRCEFCFVDGCDYVKPTNGNSGNSFLDNVFSYDHPFYCRRGVTIEQTVAGLTAIINNIWAHFPDLPQEVVEESNHILYRIVANGFVGELREAIFHLEDFFHTPSHKRREKIFTAVVSAIGAGIRRYFDNYPVEFHRTRREYLMSLPRQEENAALTNPDTLEPDGLTDYEMMLIIQALEGENTGEARATIANMTAQRNLLHANPVAVAAAVDAAADAAADEDDDDFEDEPDF